MHRHTGTSADAELLIELRCRCLGRQYKIAVEAAEIAVDALARSDRLDAVYGGGLALINELGDLDAARLDQLGIAVI